MPVSNWKRDYHSNHEKALYHSLKAARRWAKSGSYKDAAEIAKAASVAYLSQKVIPTSKIGGDEEIEMLEEIKDRTLGEIKSELEEKFEDAIDSADDEKHKKAAIKAYRAAIYYLKSHSIHLEGEKHE